MLMKDEARGAHCVYYETVISLFSIFNWRAWERESVGRARMVHGSKPVRQPGLANSGANLPSNPIYFCFRLLSNLVKQRPQAAEDAFQAVGAEFTELVAMCCHAEERETCFQEEVSRLLSKQRKMLSVAARETLSLCSRTRCVGVTDHAMPGFWVS